MSFQESNTVLEEAEQDEPPAYELKGNEQKRGDESLMIRDKSIGQFIYEDNAENISSIKRVTWNRFRK